MKKEPDQKQRIQRFSWVGFLLPDIYLLWARQYVFFWIVFLISLISVFLDNNILVSAIFSIVSLAIHILVGIKGRKLAIEKTKRPFDEFKITYKRFSKILLSIFITLRGLLIVWILAGALLSRLSGARDRANDIARKSDIQMIATTLVAYQIDHNSYPKIWWSLITIEKELLDEWMSELPMDPDKKSIFDWINASWISWQYMYMPIIEKGSKNWWFVLMAKTQTVSWSNRVVWNGIGEISKSTKQENIIPCKKITIAPVVANNRGDCSYTTWSELRYIYLN